MFFHPPSERWLICHQPKFDKSELHRRPEFEESKPNIASTSTSTSKPPVPNYHDNANQNARHAGAQVLQQSTSTTSFPNHMRSEARPNNINTNATPASTKGKAPAQTGLNTPIPTPTHNPTTTTARQPPPDRKPLIPNVTNTESSKNSNSHTKPIAASTSKPSPPPPPPKAPEADFEEAEESFNFYSDDDAFLALVDLGEGDLGQPVLPEADIGRPIGGDDGDGDFVRPQDLDEDLGGIGRKEGKEGNAPLEDPGPSGSSSSGRLGAGIHAKPEGSGMGMLSKLLPQQRQYQNQSRPPAQRISTTANNQARPQQAAQQPRMQDRHQPQPQPQSRSSNHPQNQQSSSGLAGKRPGTPSMGGFHFPPGVVTIRSVPTLRLF